MKQSVDRYLARQRVDKLNLKAVFFDMDGVLFDSMPYHVESWISAFGAYDIPFTSQEAYMCEGRTGASTIKEYYTRYKGEEPTKEQIDEIYGLKVEYFQLLSEVKVIDGVKDLISYFKDKGIELHVVTGSGQKTLLDTLSNHFPETFAANRVTCAYDVIKGKPDPEPYLVALAKAGVERHEALVVENAPLGVRSSSQAGIFSVAVNTGTLSDDMLYEYGADIVFSSMHAVKSACREIFQ